MKKKKEKFILLKMLAMMTPPCDVISQRVSESFDRKLTFRERISIKIHNLGCAICERYARHMRALHDALSTYAGHIHEHDEPSTRLPSEVKDRIVHSLKKEMS